MALLTPQLFERSYFEIGSGTCVEPLLRFSDKFSEFLFIDFELDVHDVESRLRQAINEIKRLTRSADIPALELIDLKIFDNLSFSDVELAISIGEAFKILRDACGVEEFEYFSNVVNEYRPRQWAIRAQLIRHIRHVDGTYIERPLILWLVGGEGILTYIGMGGLRKPPRYVSTIQVGLAEQHDGPMGNIFRYQKASGGILPDVWIRGRGRAQLGLQPAEPFSQIGQIFGGWKSDRLFRGAMDPMRNVVAWIEMSPELNDRQFHKHTLISNVFDVHAVMKYDSVSMPTHLANTLGVTELKNVHTAGNGTPWMRTGTEQLHNWQNCQDFVGAKKVALVFAGSEDECAVVVHWLSQLECPKVDVYLPMPIDYNTLINTIEREK